MMEKPAFEILCRNHLEIKIYVSGKVEFFEHGRLVQRPPGDMVIINRIPQLLAEARQAGAQQ